MKRFLAGTVFLWVVDLLLILSLRNQNPDFYQALNDIEFEKNAQVLIIRDGQGSANVRNLCLYTGLTRNSDMDWSADELIIENTEGVRAIMQRPMQSEVETLVLIVPDGASLEDFSRLGSAIREQLETHTGVWTYQLSTAEREALGLPRNPHSLDGTMTMLLQDAREGIAPSQHQNLLRQCLRTELSETALHLE